MLAKETLVVFVFGVYDGADLPLELEIHLMRRSAWLRKELIGCKYTMWTQLVAKNCIFINLDLYMFIEIHLMMRL